jgi:hypothetical protein
MRQEWLTGGYWPLQIPHPHSLIWVAGGGVQTWADQALDASDKRWFVQQITGLRWRRG